MLNVHGGPRFRANKRNMRFQLSGYWDSSSGQLCMVGSGTKRQINGKDLKLDVIFKSVYPNSTVINNSLITGTLESLNSVGSDTYFKPISIMSFAKANYEYSLIKKEISGGDVGSFDFDNNSSSSVSVGKRFGNCYQFANLEEYFELGYKKDCDDRNCSWIDVNIDESCTTFSCANPCGHVSIWSCLISADDYLPCINFLLPIFPLSFYHLIIV